MDRFLLFGGNARQANKLQDDDCIQDKSGGWNDLLTSAESFDEALFRMYAYLDKWSLASCPWFHVVDLEFEAEDYSPGWIVFRFSYDEDGVIHNSFDAGYSRQFYKVQAFGSVAVPDSAMTVLEHIDATVTVCWLSDEAVGKELLDIAWARNIQDIRNPENDLAIVPEEWELVEED